MIIISKDFIIKLILSLFLITPSFSDSGIPKDPYKGEGAFVEGPAMVGMTTGFITGFIIGGVAGIILLPVMLITKNEDLNIGCCMLLGTGAGGYCLGYVFGAPFYALKQIFYTFPKKIFSKKSKVTSSTLNLNHSDNASINYKAKLSDKSTKPTDLN